MTTKETTQFVTKRITAIQNVAQIHAKSFNEFMDCLLDTYEKAPEGSELKDKIELRIAEMNYSLAVANEEYEVKALKLIMECVKVVGELTGE